MNFKFRNPWSGLGKLPKQVWILSGLTLINRAGTMVLPFLTLYLTKNLNFTPGRAGFIFALYGVGALIATPVAGMLGDRFGSLLIMRASLIVSGILMLCFPYARSYGAVIGLTVALAMINEAFRPANLAYVSRVVEPELLKPAFSLVRLAINLGMSIGPAVGGLLAGVSFKWLFSIDGVTSVIAGIGLILAGSGLALSPAQLEHEAKKQKSRSSSSAAWKDMRFVYFMIALIPVTFVFFQHISSMPLYLVQDLHLSPAQYGLMFTINTLLIVFLEVPLNLSTIQWTHRKNLMVGSALFAIGFGALAFSVGFWSVTASVVIWTFGEMILFPGSSAYVSHLAPAERQGEYMGFYSMSFALAFMFAPWLGTYILQNEGGVFLWGVMFALGMLSTLLMSRIKNGKREETADEVMVETEFSA